MIKIEMNKKALKSVFDARFEAVLDNDPTLKVLLRKNHFNFNLLEWQAELAASAFRIALYETLETFIFQPCKQQ